MADLGFHKAGGGGGPSYRPWKGGVWCVGPKLAHYNNIE